MLLLSVTNMLYMLCVIFLDICCHEFVSCFFISCFKAFKKKQIISNEKNNFSDVRGWPLPPLFLFCRPSPNNSHVYVLLKKVMSACIYWPSWRQYGIMDLFCRMFQTKRWNIFMGRFNILQRDFTFIFILSSFVNNRLNFRR